MNTRKILIISLSFIMLTGVGCSDSSQPSDARKTVTPAQVKQFQDAKQQQMVDIYIPIKEQYATSKHTQSLPNLLKSGAQIEPTCYQCMSGDYFLAPDNQKPKPQDCKLSITCAVCHIMTESEFKLRLDPLETCTGCHNAITEIVPGKTVRHPQKEMFLGYGAIGVPRTPDTKYKSGLTCIECHMPNEAHTFQGKTPVASLREHKGSICVMCHADRSEEQFAVQVDNMQTKIKNNLEQLQKDLKSSQNRITLFGRNGQDISKAQTVYNNIYTNLSFIEADKSMGVHNFEYSTKIIDYCIQQKKELDNLLK